VIEESPPGGFEPTTEPPKPEVEDTTPIPQEEIEIPDGIPQPVTDEPAGPHPAPSDGVPEVIGDEPTERAPRPGEERTQPNRAPDTEAVPEPITDEPAGPVSTLPDGALVFGEQRPFTPERAEQVYEALIAGSKGRREAMILEHVDTGERVVVQGSESLAAVSETQWQAYRNARQGDGGRWRGIRHYHGVGEGKVTAPEHRLPSGAGGDMQAVQKDAQKYFKPQEEVLDIVTERGREQVRFGYDQTQEKSWWVLLPGASEPQRFKSLAHYHLWFEVQTQTPHPERLN